MKCKDREGNILDYAEGQDNMLEKLYGNSCGRAVLKVATLPAVSKMAGFLLDTELSSNIVPGFLKKNKDINMNDYVEKDYSSFNDFFTREVKPELRPINMEKDVLISPADGRVSVYNIDDNSIFEIKDSYYTVESLLKSEKAADKYKGGKCVIIRLCVDNYHRYCYLDDCYKSKNKFIPGVLHTVNPVANDYYEIYKENSRECTILHTENFGNVMQIEVGALMVGRIKNHHGKISPTAESKYPLHRGMEKGMFEFGGSTIVLLFEKDKVDLDDDLLQNTLDGYETAVKMGEKIGVKHK